MSGTDCEAELLPLFQFLTKLFEFSFPSPEQQPLLTEVYSLRLASIQEKIAYIVVLKPVDNFTHAEF